VDPDYLHDLEVLFQPHFDPSVWHGFVLYYLHDYIHTLLHYTRCSEGVTRGKSPWEFFFGQFVFAYILGGFGTQFSVPWFSNFDKELRL
jgi:hypothetical protein